jgi:hypothetical protein
VSDERRDRKEPVPAPPAEGAPIVVTGMPRAGTSWVGKMLDASGRVVYINEPLNVRRPPGRSPGVLRARVHYRFQYISPANEDEYLRAFREMLALRYHVLAEIRVSRSVGDVLRMAKYWSSFVRGRVQQKRPLLDDPYAVFSGEWLASRLGCHVVVVVRHPAAIASSRKRLGWKIDFGDLLNQPVLVDDWLHPFRQEMEAMRGSSDVIAESGLLWRMIYHVVAGYRTRHRLVHVVRHEDLSREPVSEFARLYTHVGLPFTEEVERTVIGSVTGPQDQQAHAWSFSRKGISRTGFRPLDSRAHISAWKAQLTPAEIERIRELTAGVADDYYADDDWR